MSLLSAVLAVQVASFLALGAVFLAAGQWRLGVAQILLAAVQLTIYSGSMS